MRFVPAVGDSPQNSDVFLGLGEADPLAVAEICGLLVYVAGIEGDREGQRHESAQSTPDTPSTGRGPELRVPDAPARERHRRRQPKEPGQGVVEGQACCPAEPAEALITSSKY